MKLPITDIMIVQGEGASAPPGWEKLPTDLNEAAGGSWLYIGFRRDPALQSREHWVTDIRVLIDNEPTPDGWTKLPTDLNQYTNVHEHNVYLAYVRGGPESPIVDGRIVRDRKQLIPGYKLIDHDLNTGARGSTLLLSVVRQSQVMLTIERIACKFASTGFGSAAKSMIDDVLDAAAAAGGTAVNMSEMAKGPHAVAVGSAAAAGEAILKGQGVRSGIKEIVSNAGSSIDDDVYITVNGVPVWPLTHIGITKLGNGDAAEVDFTMPLTGDTVVTVMDSDTFGSGFADELGKATFTPDSKSNCYMFFNQDEGSVYFVDIRVDHLA